MYWTRLDWTKLDWTGLNWTDLFRYRDKWQDVVIAKVPSGGSTNCWEFLDKL